jgi:hypothetical protein
MDFITLSSQIISFLKTNSPQKNRASWVKWREFIEKVYEFDIDPNKIKFFINHGKGSFRKSIKSIDDIAPLILNEPKGKQTKVIQLIKLYFTLEENEKEQLNINNQKDVWENLKEDLSISDKDEQNIIEQVTEWLEANEDKSFFTPINIKASLIPINLDFFLRCILLWMYNTGRLELSDSMDSESMFYIGNFMVISLTVFLFALIRGRLIKNKTTKLFRELNINKLKLKVQNNAWNYTLVFLYVIIGVFVNISLNESGDLPLSIATILGVLQGVYLLVILRLFSKRTPKSKEVLEQLELIQSKNLDRGLTHEENDEEIINMEVKLRSINEQMEAFVLEAALFGALAFSGFLSVIASDVFSIATIEAFSLNIAALFKSFVVFDVSENALTMSELLSKNGLLALLCYETLFCSVFFLSVIASRLRFNDLTDLVDKSLQLSRNYNEREEELVSNNKANTNGKIKTLSKKIRQQLRLGNLKQEEIGPIMEYMKFFRTLGISTFFVIIVTGGLFISVELSIIMLFISLLSLFYFRINKVIWALKSFNIRMQEFYFTVDKYVHWVSWSLVFVAFIMRSFALVGGGIVMFLGFSFLFLHYLFSLFIPDTVEDSKSDAFESKVTFLIFLKKMLKVGLAFFFLGFMFKTMHWPGAGPLLIAGLLFLTIYHFMSPKNTGTMWMNILFSFTMGVWFLGALFKFQYWPGAFIFVWTATPLIIVVGILVFWKRKIISAALKRTTYILLTLSLLMQVNFFGYAITRLSLNYNNYRVETEERSLRYPLYISVTEDGYANPTTKEQKDSLQVSAKRFTNFLLEYKNDFNSLNGQAWDAFRKSEDEVVLNEAIIWVKQSIKLEKNYMNMDTYLNLLMKLEHWEKAEKVAFETIELGKKEGADINYVQDMLIQIRKELPKQDTINSVVSD